MKYIHTTKVEALPRTYGEYLWSSNSPISKNFKNEEEGYRVVYSDGYTNWFPKKEFEECSRPCDEMTFGDAIEALKNGLKVSRKGWNSKGMWLWLKPQTTIKAEWCKDPELKKVVEENGGQILGLGTICMYTHDSSGRRAILTGWSASQSDMLSNDWQIVEDV